MKIDERTRDISRLEDILSRISDIEKIFKEDKDNFIVQKAMERCFSILGEACRRVSQNLQNQYPDIPWHSIISLRNIVIHEYDKVVTENLWEIAEHKIPSLRDWIEGILEKIKQ